MYINSFSVKGCDPNENYPNHEGETALHAAAANGHATIVHLLIQVCILVTNYYFIVCSIQFHQKVENLFKVGQMKIIIELFDFVPC